MKETITQYKQRILSYQAGRDPLKVQASTPGKIARLLKGVPRRKLMQRPALGKWSVAEIVAHLADTELVGAYRIRLMLGAPGTSLQSFDQDTWAVEGQYAKRDPQKSLDLFRAVREANLALFRSLKPAQWRHYGIHAERGRETPETYLHMYAGHDINHLRQIEAILSKSVR